MGGCGLGWGLSVWDRICWYGGCGLGWGLSVWDRICWYGVVWFRMVFDDVGWGGVV